MRTTPSVQKLTVVALTVYSSNNKTIVLASNILTIKDTYHTASIREQKILFYNLIDNAIFLRFGSGHKTIAFGILLDFSFSFAGMPGEYFA